MTMSRYVGVGWAGGRRPRLTYFQIYVTFILQWIAFIFGRDKEKDQ